ncbi:hypothetical protein B0J11DRAFT_522148 [Dendryphion nanum]|uniref:DUF1275 domain protein n=1 Tax=Dendryphion nanum TaxID=256645 RepID=A0A9P9E814_9PLEO|nr:hypothetical protein B0J11DRAFT_522148 [Dendryphion nanum]
MNRFTKQYIFETLDLTHGDIPLLISSFTTGLLDATSFNNWGVFIGMQTGNTIILALSTASLPKTSPHAAATSLTSLGSFLVGAYITLLLSRHCNKHSRFFLSLCFFSQALLLILGALLATFHLVPEDQDGTGTQLYDIKILTAVPPLAFQFGMQMATARILGFSELPTNVLTSSYTDLMGDPDLFRWGWNKKRDRRLASVVLMMAGGICAAWMMRSGCRIYVQAWIAAGLKVGTALGIWGVMRRKEERGEGDGSMRQGKKAEISV